MLRDSGAFVVTFTRSNSSCNEMYRCCFFFAAMVASVNAMCACTTAKRVPSGNSGNAAALKRSTARLKARARL